MIAVRVPGGPGARRRLRRGALRNLQQGDTEWKKGFHRADRVSVAGADGVVKDIDLRYTTLEHDGQTILIPNSTLFTNVITVGSRAGSS